MTKTSNLDFQQEIENKFFSDTIIKNFGEGGLSYSELTPRGGGPEALKFLKEFLKKISVRNYLLNSLLKFRYQIP